MAAYRRLLHYVWKAAVANLVHTVCNCNCSVPPVHEAVLSDVNKIAMEIIVTRAKKVILVLESSKIAGMSANNTEVASAVWASANLIKGPFSLQVFVLDHAVWKWVVHQTNASTPAKFSCHAIGGRSCCRESIHLLLHLLWIADLKLCVIILEVAAALQKAY